MNLYLFFGYAVFWSILFVYLLVLHSRQTKINRDLRALRKGQRDV